MDPWGTPFLIVPSKEDLPLTNTYWVLSLRYDLKNKRELSEKWYVESLSRRRSWLTKSNALERSKNRTPVISDLFMDVSQLLTTWERAEWQEWRFRNPDWKGYMRLLDSRNIFKCLWTCFSIGLDITDRSEMGLKFVGLDRSRYFGSGTTLAFFKTLGKEPWRKIRL